MKEGYDGCYYVDMDYAGIGMISLFSSGMVALLSRATRAMLNPSDTLDKTTVQHCQDYLELILTCCQKINKKNLVIKLKYMKLKSITMIK